MTRIMSMGPGRAQPESEKCLTSSGPTTCKGPELCVNWALIQGLGFGGPILCHGN